jgi:hypothetical protein
MKSNVTGITVPTIATTSQITDFVLKVYKANGQCFASTGRALDLHPETIRQFVLGRQQDSPKLRENFGIKKTRPVARAHMRTDNEIAAVKKLLEFYSHHEIARGICKNLQYHEVDNLIWYIRQEQSGCEIDMEGLEERIKRIES